MSACTYVRRGIAANPYIAEGLTGRTKINEHLYWHASNRNGPEWATDYLSAPVCNWSAQVTPDMAIRFGKLLGNGPRIWLHMQQRVDIWVLEQRGGYESIEQLHVAY